MYLRLQGEAGTDEPPARLKSGVADPTDLIANNREWAARVLAEDSGYFRRLKDQQAPRYLWIGCADSRVPANVITGLDPGEVFVHRNIANVVPHTDLNVLSVLEFAVKVLRVEHVIVCGHYGCGGIDAALDHEPHGLLDSWLRHIKDVAARHEEELLELTDRQHRAARLCELNSLEQARNVCYTSVVQEAWASGQPLSVHAWVYGISDGLIHDLHFRVSSPEDLLPAYRLSLKPGPPRT